MKKRKRFPEVEREKIVQAAKRSLRKNEGKEALQYLKDRGFNDTVINQFNVGYCPSTVNHECSGRIITPIYDAFDNLIVVSTRRMQKKYKDRFWHEQFQKKRYLYGINNAKNAILKNNKAIIVEGEFDVLSLHSNGFPIAVAPCGSAFSLFQAATLARYCDEVFLLFDGDNAGRAATRSALKLYNNNDLDAYDILYIPVFLPEGTDPDDFVRKYGKYELKKILKKAKEDRLKV